MPEISAYEDRLTSGFFTPVSRVREAEEQKRKQEEAYAAYATAHPNVRLRCRPALGITAPLPIQEILKSTLDEQPVLAYPFEGSNFYPRDGRIFIKYAWNQLRIDCFRISFRGVLWHGRHRKVWRDLRRRGCDILAAHIGKYYGLRCRVRYRRSIDMYIIDLY